MIYIPDLMTPFVEGQRQANEDNWNDLKNYEAIERARTQNDAANLALQYDLHDFGNQLAIGDAAGTRAYITETSDLLRAPGRYAQDRVSTDYNLLTEQGWRANRDAAGNAITSSIGANIDNMNTRANETFAKNSALNATRPVRAQATYDSLFGTAQATSTNAKYMPQRAEKDNKVYITTQDNNLAAGELTGRQIEAEGRLLPLRERLASMGIKHQTNEFDYVDEQRARQSRELAEAGAERAAAQVANLEAQLARAREVGAPAGAIEALIQMRNLYMNKLDTLNPILQEYGMNPISYNRDNLTTFDGAMAGGQVASLPNTTPISTTTSGVNQYGPLVDGYVMPGATTIVSPDSLFSTSGTTQPQPQPQPQAQQNGANMMGSGYSLAVGDFSPGTVIGNGRYEITGEANIGGQEVLLIWDSIENRPTKISLDTAKNIVQQDSIRRRGPQSTYGGANLFGFGKQ